MVMTPYNGNHRPQDLYRSLLKVSLRLRWQTSPAVVVQSCGREFVTIRGVRIGSKVTKLLFPCSQTSPLENKRAGEIVGIVNKIRRQVRQLVRQVALLVPILLDRAIDNV